MNLGQKITQNCKSKSNQIKLVSCVVDNNSNEKIKLEQLFQIRRETGADFIM